jgi:protein-S-isoprenylcysteine O-methyltransferase Ste14
METAAYWVALLAVVGSPPFLLMWFIIHPFTTTWRRLGAAKTYLVLLLVVAAGVVVLYILHRPLLRIHFGVRVPLVVIAAVLFVAGLFLGVQRLARLTPAAMLGLPEVSPKGYPGRLITEGIYAHLRHPRYVEVGLGLAAMALFTNYLAMYVLSVAYVPLIYLVVLLEERELRARFGEQYEQYSRQVPRFLPRLFPRKKTSP